MRSFKLLCIRNGTVCWPRCSVCQNDFICEFIYYDVLCECMYNILRVYFTGVLLFFLSRLFSAFVFGFFCGRQRLLSFSLLFLLVSFIRLKIWIGFHFVLFTLFLQARYSRDLFSPKLFFFLLLYCTQWCCSSSPPLHFIVQFLGITMCMCL